MVVATESATEYSEFEFVNGVPVLFKNANAVIDLLNSIEINMPSTPKDILIAEVRAGHTRLIGTEVAIVLTAKPVRREGYTDVENSAFTANALCYKRTP